MMTTNTIRVRSDQTFDDIFIIFIILVTLQLPFYSLPICVFLYFVRIFYPVGPIGGEVEGEVPLIWETGVPAA